MRSLHSLRRSPLVPVVLVFLAPAWMGCNRDTGTTHLTSAASSSPAATAKRTPIPDADIAQAITRHLKEDSALRSERIQVSVVNGICTLAGPVKTLLAKERALRVAETLRGVRSVIDQVDVQPVVRTDDQLKGDVMRELQQGKFTRTDLVSYAPDEALQKPHVIDYAFRSDEEIARAVRDAFKLDPRLVRLEPRVEAHNGVVELTGTVDSVKARRAAELDARDTVGVTSDGTIGAKAGIEARRSNILVTGPGLRTVRVKFAI